MKKTKLLPFLKATSRFVGVHLLIAASLFSFNSHAQGIISLDTVTVGSTVSFDLSGSDKFHTYAWEFESNTFKPLLTNSVAIANTGTNQSQFDVAAGSTVVYDAATKSYYGFVTCASTGFHNPHVQRIDFGSNPNNSNPSTVNLGNPGSAFIDNSSGYHNMQDFKLVKDDNGVYHAFINNGGIVHWVFGNGIDNTPTQATRIFTNPSVLGMSMNMAVIKYNNSWYIFTGQAFGNEPGLVRLDLGSNLNAIPANIPYNAFPVISGLSNASYLAVLKENSNWYITMYAGATLIRYSFGTNLINNNPTITDLGSSNAMTTNRGLNYLKTCDSTLMVGTFENGTIYSYQYSNNSIANAPIPNDLGQKFGSSVAMQTLPPYWYKDTLWAISSSFNNNSTNTVFRFPLGCFNSNNTSINYYNSGASHIFNTPGTFDVELYCDQGDNRGPQSFCKQIVVVSPTAIEDIDNSIKPTSIYPNPLMYELNITIPESSVLAYSVSDIAGREIFSHTNDAMSTSPAIHVDLKQYSMKPGLYILKVISRNGDKYSAKFIKR